MLLQILLIEIGKREVVLDYNYFPQPQRPLTKPVIPFPPSAVFLGDIPAWVSRPAGAFIWLRAKSKNKGLQGTGLE